MSYAASLILSLAGLVLYLMLLFGNDHISGNIDINILMKMNMYLQIKVFFSVTRCVYIEIMIIDSQDTPPPLMLYGLLQSLR